MSGGAFVEALSSLLGRLFCNANVACVSFHCLALAGGMVDKVLLRIVIPTYNRSDRIVGLLSNIKLAATDPRVQVVVVDDFSCERERDKLRSSSLSFNCCDFLFLPENIGGGGARNAGALGGGAKWIWFIDDDDVVSSDTILGVLNDIVSMTEEKFVFLSANFHRDGQEVRVVPTGGDVFYEFSRYGNKVNTSCVIFDFQLFRSIGGWDEKLVAGQDTDLLLRAAEVAEACVLEKYHVDVIYHAGERVTTNPKKQMVGKIQFLAKNFRRLHFVRLARYIATIVVFYPYIRRLIGR